MNDNDEAARADREAAALILNAEVLPGIKLNPAGVTVHQLVALAYAKGNRDGYAECMETTDRVLTCQEKRS